VIGIDVVRQVTVPGSFFGLFPTASQESRPVERIGAVRLRAVPREPVLGVSGRHRVAHRVGGRAGDLTCAGPRRGTSGGAGLPRSPTKCCVDAYPHS
jgi:hypothetical protein